jgi:hypothetical protein
MSKRVLAIVIAALLVGGIYTVANAGVEGSFCFDFNITPQTTIAQVTKIDLNFEGILDLDITISGLTISTFMAFGMAGIETVVFDLETTIGFLDIYDEFWFSVPYAGDLKDTRLDDQLYFVKKRVNLTATLGGLTLNTLLIFEDLNFNYPYTHTPVGEQVWAFGICTTISGQTVSGITIISTAGLNCEPQKTNKIKKYDALGTVAGEDFGFTVEKITIKGVQIAGINISNYTEFRPGAPIKNTMTFSTTIMGIGLSVALSTTDITQIGTLAGITFTAALDSISVKWVDKNASLAFDDNDYIEVKASFPIQTATLSAYFKSVPTTGITAAKIGLSLPVPVGTFSGTLVYGGSPLSWQQFDFALASTVGGLDVTLSASFGLYGLKYADVKICVPFSA